MCISLSLIGVKILIFFSFQIIFLNCSQFLFMLRLTLFFLSFPNLEFFMLLWWSLSKQNKWSILFNSIISVTSKSWSFTFWWLSVYQVYQVCQVYHFLSISTSLHPLAIRLLAFLVTTHSSSSFPLLLLACPPSHSPIPNPYKTAL